MKSTMRFGGRLVFCAASIYAVTASVATASTLYTNGALNGNLNDWVIDVGDGSAVADSFTLNSAATLTSVDFVVWVNSGDTPDTVEWAITNTDFGAVIPGASGTADTLNPAFVFTNDSAFGNFDVYDVSFSVPSVSLAAGSYWLQLQNGTTADSAMMGWDENDGPSAAFSATVVAGGGPPPYADITSNIDTACSFFNNCTSTPQTGSETFDIQGTTPEPGTVTMLLSGLLMLAGAAFYRKRHSVQN